MVLLDEIRFQDTIKTLKIWGEMSWEVSSDDATVHTIKNEG